jgi:hypothetical protein
VRLGAGRRDKNTSSHLSRPTPHNAQTQPPPPAASSSPDTPHSSWPLTALAALAAALTVTAATPPPPAHADLPTATLDEATAAARPLPQQPVRTGRVWALIGLGAAGVFGAAVAVENNAAWFPAIAKANRAMAATKARAAAEEAAARSASTGGAADAVAAGIADASRRAREAGEGAGRGGGSGGGGE